MYWYNIECKINTIDIIFFNKMEDLVWSKKECNNIPEYYNREEDDFYCEECAYSYFDENEFEKIGSVKIIKQMIELSKHLLDKVQDYVNKEQLAIKWKKALSQYLTFYDELKLITNELKDTEENKTLANLFLIQQRSTNLKSINVIIFFKYLCFW